MKKLILTLLLIFCISGASAEDTRPFPSADEMPEAVQTSEQKLMELRLYRSGYIEPESYELYRLDEDYWLYRMEGWPARFGNAAAEELTGIMAAYDIFSWDGFHETDPDVLDGEEFFLSAVFADGTSVTAGGSNAFPPDYFRAMDRIVPLLKNAFDGEPEQLSGTFLYEGKGNGGDFTLTLNEDSTYTFSEGPLSSYLGGGTWFQEGNILMLYEENGMPLYNNFIPKDHTLIFSGEDSDNFPTVKVPEGGRFVLRVRAEEE